MVSCINRDSVTGVWCSAIWYGDNQWLRLEINRVNRNKSYKFLTAKKLSSIIKNVHEHEDLVKFDVITMINLM